MSILATDPSFPVTTAAAVPGRVFVSAYSADSGNVRTSTTSEADARGLLGFSRDGADAGKNLLLWRDGDIVPGFTGLTPGPYYLNASGPVLRSSLSAAAWTRRVGVALSPTHMLLSFGDVERIGADANPDATETYSATTAVLIGDATNNPTVDLPGSGAVTFSGNPTVSLGTNRTTVGSLRIGADVDITRAAANVAEIADSLFSVGASLGIKTTTLDANATAVLNAGGFSLGAGGVTAVDWNLSRQAASVAELATGDFLFCVGASAIGRRNASADAHPTAALTANGLELGAGGATATDILIRRQAADVAEIPDDLFAVGKVLGIKTTTGDANATARLDGQALHLGAGGVTASDFKIERAGPNQAETGDGDGFYIVGTAQLGRKASPGDEHPTMAITNNGLEAGAGGASAPDVRLARSGANVLGLAAGDTFGTDTIAEVTGGAGVTIDGVTLKDDGIYSLSLGDYANDGAAAGGGIAVGQLYRNGSVVMIRVA